MTLSPHFTVAEFAASDTAARLGIDNSLPDELVANAMATAMMLERIREQLSTLAGRTVPIIITSGYRCPALNRSIGSGKTSDHITASAADFRAPAFGTPYEVCIALAPHVGDLRIGQLIFEFARWVHVSTRRPEKPVNRILTISGRGTVPGIVEVA